VYASKKDQNMHYEDPDAHVLDGCVPAITTLCTRHAPPRRRNVTTKVVGNEKQLHTHRYEENAEKVKYEENAEEGKVEILLRFTIFSGGNASVIFSPDDQTFICRASYSYSATINN
jgi:hypothetical protein